MSNIKVKKGVSKRHELRVKEVILESILKDKPNNWVILESDAFRDRAYVLNKTLGKEFSISFSDKDKGYSYSVFQRNEIGNKEYQILVAQRPELKKMNRKDICTVDLIDEGYKSGFVIFKPNKFSKYIEKNNIKIKEEKVFLTLAISASNGIHNTLIQVMPWSEEVTIINGISKSDIEKMMSGMPEFAEKTLKGNLEQNYHIDHIVLESGYDAYLDDCYRYFERIDFKINIGNAKPIANSN